MVQHRSFAAPRRAALLLPVLWLLLTASPTQAATVFASAETGGVFVGGDSGANTLFLATPESGKIRIRAEVGTIVPGDGTCTTTAADTVDCTVTALAAQVAADAGNDVIDVDGPITASVFGGAGDDILRGGSLGDYLGGEAGDDQMMGRGGDDDLRGDGGNDSLDGGEGSDLAIGGLGADTLEDNGTSGTDSVTYKNESVTAGVRLTVGDGANDGGSSGAEGDDVREGFERLQGSNFNDVIRGGVSSETINGGSGDDDIDGGAGADTIEGNGGNDTIRARDGVADVRLDCDAASDPVATHGAADAAFIDGAGLDPAPSRCETVDSGGGSMASPFKRVRFRIPNFVTPTGVCGRKKGHCEKQEAYKRLNPKGKASRNIRFKATEVEGLSGVPARLRKSIVPGAIFEQSPKKGTKIVTTAEKPATIKVSYYTPNPERNCPVTENINERAYSADYTLADLVTGMSLRDALVALRENRCTQQDYDIDYRYAAGETGTTVSRAKRIKEGGRDQLRLTVKHSAPTLQLGIQPIKPVKNRLPMALASRTNEIHFVVSKTQVTDFVVTVATKAGVGFKNARVELRNPSGDMVDYATTNAQGVATFRKSPIKTDGAYELWASVSDDEGDALVGWKPIKAIAINQAFLGFTGRTYDYAKKTYRLRGTGGSASARVAQVGGETLASTLEQAKRACDDVYPLLQPLNSAATSRTPGALTAIENSSLRNATEDVCQLALGELTLEQMIARGTTPTIATLGGSLTLAIGQATVVKQAVLTFRKNQALLVAEGALRVGKGALGFVSDRGVTIYPGGSFSLQSGGGTGFGPEGARGRVVLDASSRTLAIERLGPTFLVGITPNGTGGLLGQDGAGLIGQDGAGLLAKGGSSVVAGGAGNIISDNGGGLIGQDGAGLIGQDGAGLVSNKGFGLISDKGAGIVAGGADNLIAGASG